MAKYLLINVIDRTIFGQMFSKKSLAYQQMEKELCQEMEWEDDEKEDLLRIGREEANYDYGINKTSAWANADDGDKDCDWSIVKVTKPYALISVVDREISFAEYDNIEKAKEQMLKEFKECPDWEDDFMIGEENYDFGFFETYAWANADDGDMNCDWSIVNLDELEIN